MDNITGISKDVKSFSNKLSDALLSAGRVIGLILAIIGFAIIIYQLSIFYKIRRINSWPILPQAGTVTDRFMENTNNNVTYSALVASSTFYELYYRTRVSFEYELGGKKYNSIKLSYYEPWNNNPIIAKDEMDTYKIGDKVDIRVNPKNYNEAYILNKPYESYTSLILGIILAAIGVYIFYKTDK